MQAPWIRLEGTLWPIVLASACIGAVALFLFAYPLVSAAIAFAVPFTAIGALAAVLAGMNRRRTLWHGGRPLLFSIADIGFLLCFAAFSVYGFALVSDAWTNVLYVVMAFVTVAIFRVAFIELRHGGLGLSSAGTRSHLRAVRRVQRVPTKVVLRLQRPCCWSAGLLFWSSVPRFRYLVHPDAKGLSTGLHCSAASRSRSAWP